MTNAWPRRMAPTPHGHAAMGLLACLGLGGLGACTTDELGEPLPLEPSELVLPDRWVPGDLATDPLPHHPPDPSCPAGTWGEEDGRFEVQTGACEYAWMVQPALTALHPGDAIAITSWHQGLDALFPGEGHIALAVDGEVVWEEVAPIPSGPEVFDVEVPIERYVPEGAEVGLHLHNHGFNSWSLGAVTRWPRQAW